MMRTAASPGVRHRHIKKKGQETMPRVHFVNVAPGDCTIIQHVSKRVTVMDICDGNMKSAALEESKEMAYVYKIAAERVNGNFRMCESRTNPLDYMEKIGVKNVFRFVLSHPDMDHMDGLDALAEKYKVYNFWDSGSRREKPPFEGGRYKEEDWDRYVAMRDGNNEGTGAKVRQAGHRFAYANRTDGDKDGGDGLHILAPTSELVIDADESDDVNDGSYVLLYRSSGGKILLPGDAHDKSFEHIRKNYRKDVAGCAFMLAPHHGRDSNRDYTFLDDIRPTVTLLGCSPSQHIDYRQWSQRGLEYFMSNQAGNVVLDISDKLIEVYVENKNFVIASKRPLIQNDLGYFMLYRIVDGALDKSWYEEAAAG